METKAHYALLGGVVVAGLAFLMLFAAWITGNEFNRQFAEYDLIFDGPVRGLAEGSEVRFNGIKVGEIRRLRIDPENSSRVIAEARIDGTTPVRSDSEGRLEPIGFTGLNLLQISPGTPTSALLRQQFGQPRPRIPARQAQIDELVAQGESIAMQATDALRATQGLLTDENVARVSAILDNLETVSASLAANARVVSQTGEAAVALRDGARAFGAAAERIEGLAGDLQSRTPGLDTRAQGLLDSSQVTVERIGEAAAVSRDAIARLDGAAAVAGEQTLPEIAAAAQDLRSLSARLERLAAEVERNPQAFVAGPNRQVVRVAP